ncbi:hypothetical protein [Bacillus sp. N1-1]|jgi:hypothetical protein|uniref:hypothetical protein n=1 Tax=Bacillus sp. N1-1 TaxID=2682541 RepID=UPI0013161822|nr:hypothetical protein [Bacillus sp. N1-1]QHA93247.1 hypothetical protein GNK04_18400 [Bacillus sp. N1-1]
MQNIDLELEKLEEDLEQPLKSYLATSPRSEDTQKLLLSLQDSFDELKPSQVEFQFDQDAEPAKPSLAKQCLNQFSSYHWAYWLISFLIFAMLTVISSGSMESDSLFPIVVPIYLLFGVLYSYKTWNKEMRMVESITPFPPALLLLSKLLVVLVVNIGLSLLSTLYIVKDNTMINPGTFLLHWFAPLLFLTGLLAFVMFHKGVIAGFIAALLGWVLTFLVLPYTVFAISGEAFQQNFLFVVSYLVILGLGVGMLFLSYRKSLRLSYL